MTGCSRYTAHLAGQCSTRPSRSPSIGSRCPPPTVRRQGCHLTGVPQHAWRLQPIVASTGALQLQASQCLPWQQQAAGRRLAAGTGCVLCALWSPRLAGLLAEP